MAYIFTGSVVACTACTFVLFFSCTLFVTAATYLTSCCRRLRPPLPPRGPFLRSPKFHTVILFSPHFIVVFPAATPNPCFCCYLPPTAASSPTCTAMTALDDPLNRRLRRRSRLTRRMFRPPSLVFSCLAISRLCRRFSRRCHPYLTP